MPNALLSPTRLSYTISNTAAPRKETTGNDLPKCFEPKKRPLITTPLLTHSSQCKAQAVLARTNHPGNNTNGNQSGLTAMPPWVPPTTDTTRKYTIADLTNAPRAIKPSSSQQNPRTERMQLPRMERTQPASKTPTTVHRSKTPFPRASRDTPPSVPTSMRTRWESAENRNATAQVLPHQAA